MDAAADIPSELQCAVCLQLLLEPVLWPSADAAGEVGAQARTLGRIVVIALIVYGLVMAFMTLAAGRVELAPFAGLFVGGAVMLLGLHAVALNAPRSA